MPDRVVRDEMLTSERYWSVPESAQLLFHHLILIVDDFGNSHAGYFVIRNKCYAGRHVENSVIDKLLTLLADVDLIRVYEVDGVRYLHIPRFRQRMRTTKRKFPPSQWDSEQVLIDKSGGQASDKCQTHDGHLLAKRGEGNGSEGNLKEAIPPGGGQSVWDFGITILCDQGMKETTARTFIGSLLKEWPEAVVEDALRAAVGKFEAKAYIRGVLKNKPKKGQIVHQGLAL